MGYLNFLPFGLGTFGLWTFALVYKWTLWHLVFSTIRLLYNWSVWLLDTWTFVLRDICSFYYLDTIFLFSVHFWSLKICSLVQMNFFKRLNEVNNIFASFRFAVLKFVTVLIYREITYYKFDMIEVRVDDRGFCPRGSPGIGGFQNPRRVPGDFCPGIPGENQYKYCIFLPKKGENLMQI